MAYYLNMTASILMHTLSLILLALPRNIGLGQINEALLR